MPHRDRVPQNAPGDFYVEAGCCLACCLPHGEAPDLMNEVPDADHHDCYFRRQPQTPEETERAVQAIAVSCLACIRYGGTDPAILRRLNDLGRGDCCDHEPAAATGTKA